MEGCSKCNGGGFRTRLSKALASMKEGSLGENHKVLWAAVETKSPKLYARDLTQIVHASGGLVYDARVCRAGEDEWNLQLKGRLHCPNHVLHRAKLQALMLILDNSVYHHSPPSPKRRRIDTSHEYIEGPRRIVLERKWSTIEWTGKPEAPRPSGWPARPPNGYGALFELWEPNGYGGSNKIEILDPRHGQAVGKPQPCPDIRPDIIEDREAAPSPSRPCKVCRKCCFGIPSPYYDELAVCCAFHDEVD